MPDLLAVWDRFEPQRFLDEAWQARPLLVRGWLRPEPLSRKKLLDAAGRGDLGARLVRGRRRDANWRVDYAPFPGNEVPISGSPDWTLLIQDLDKIIPQVNEITKDFSFLPGWLVDDVMVSQAGPGGSVGPHVDAYDVFLVQAAGNRRWELAARFDPALDPDFELAVLKNFNPETSRIAEPGDVLYLPAGIAHHGIAEADCQTWSVGLRSPSAAELLAELAAWRSDSENNLPRLNPRDFDREAPDRLDAGLIAQARALLNQAVEMNDGAMAEWLGRTLTGYRLWEPGEDAAPPAGLALRPGCRLAWHDSGRLFIDGTAIDCPADLARELCRRRRLPPNWADHGAWRNAITWLREAGYLANPLAD